MKYVKILGLLAVAAAAMMAFAAGASATTVTGPNGEETPTIHAVHEGTHVELHNSIANIKCNSTAEGTVTAHGTGLAARGPLAVLSFTGCTDGWDVDVISRGELSIHYKEASGTHNIGTLTSSGATVTATHTPSGLTCHYRTENTHIGTVTGGNPATLHIEAVIQRHGGSFLCGPNTANWTGAYVTTNTLKIDP